jgi:hypothetical protein
MKANRLGILVWTAVIAVLVVVEVAEITHFFTLPVSNALCDPLAVVFALIFTTILALVGAIFVGIYLSHRLLSPSGFSPFEEEMLRMRTDLREVRRMVEEMHEDPKTAEPPKGGPT